MWPQASPEPSFAHAPEEHINELLPMAYEKVWWDSLVRDYLIGRTITIRDYSGGGRWPQESIRVHDILMWNVRRGMSYIGHKDLHVVPYYPRFERLGDPIRIKTFLAGLPLHEKRRLLREVQERRDALRRGVNLGRSSVLYNAVGFPEVPREAVGNFLRQRPKCRRSKTPSRKKKRRSSKTKKRRT